MCSPFIRLSLHLFFFSFQSTISTGRISKIQILKKEMYKNIFIKIFKIIFKIIWEYFCVHFSRWRFGIFPFLTGTKNIWSCLFGLVCAVGLFWFPHVVRNLICANAGHYFFKWRSLFFNFWVGRQKAYKHKCFFLSFIREIQRTKTLRVCVCLSNEDPRASSGMHVYQLLCIRRAHRHDLFLISLYHTVLN